MPYRLKNFLLFASLVMISSFGSAQEVKTFTVQEIERAYQRYTMKEFNGKYEIDGVQYVNGIFNENLRALLWNSEKSKMMYKVYRRRAWAGAGIGFVLPAGLLAVAAFTAFPPILLAVLPCYIGAYVLFYKAAEL